LRGSNCAGHRTPRHIILKVHIAVTLSTPY